MTGDDFRDWRRRNRITRPALLSALRGLGWTDLGLRALDKWQRRGVPQHAAVVLGFMERHPQDWRPSPESETAQTHESVTRA